MPVEEKKEKLLDVNTLTDSEQLHQMLSDEQSISPIILPALETLSAIELLWLMTKIDYHHIPDTWHYFNAQQGIEINFSLIDINQLKVPEKISALFCLAASNPEKLKIISVLIKKALLKKISEKDLMHYEALFQQHDAQLAEAALQTTLPPAIEALTQPSVSKAAQDQINMLLLQAEKGGKSQYKSLFLALHLLPILDDLAQFELNDSSEQLLHLAMNDPNVWQYLQKSLTHQLGKRGELAHLILTIQTLYCQSIERKAEDSSVAQQINLDRKLWFTMMLWSGMDQTDFYDRKIINESHSNHRTLSHPNGMMMGVDLKASMEFIRQRPMLFQLIQSSMLPDAARQQLVPFQRHFIQSGCQTLTPQSLMALYVQLKTDMDPAKLSILKLKKPSGIERVHFDQLEKIVALSPEHQKFVESSLESVLNERYPDQKVVFAQVKEQCNLFLKGYLSILVKDLSFTNLRWMDLILQDNRADFQKKIVQSMVIRPEAEIDLGTPEANVLPVDLSQHNQIVKEVMSYYQDYSESELAAVSIERNAKLAAIKTALQHTLSEKQKRHVDQARKLKNCLKVILRNPDLKSELAVNVKDKLDPLYQVDLRRMQWMSLANHYDLERTLPVVAIQEPSIAPMVAIALARNLPITWRQWMLHMCKCLDFSNRPDVKIPGLPPDMIALVSLRLKWPSVREKVYSLFYSAEDNIRNHPEFLPDEALYLPSEEILFEQPDTVVDIKQKLTDQELQMLTEAIQSNPQLTIVDFGLMGLPKNIDTLVDILSRHPHLKMVRGSKDIVRLIDKLIEKVYDRPQHKAEKTDLLIFSLLSNCHKKYSSEVIPKVLSGEMAPPVEMPDTDRQLLVRLQRIIETDPMAALKVNWYCSMTSCLEIKGELLKHGVEAIDLDTHSLGETLEKALVVYELHQRYPQATMPAANEPEVDDQGLKQRLSL